MADYEMLRALAKSIGDFNSFWRNRYVDPGAASDH